MSSSSATLNHMPSLTANSFSDVAALGSSPFPSSINRLMENLSISNYSFSPEFHEGINNLYLKSAPFEDSQEPVDFISLPADEVGAEEEIRYEEKDDFFESMVKQEPLDAVLGSASGLLGAESDAYLDGGPFCTSAPNYAGVLNIYNELLRPTAPMESGALLSCNFCSASFKKELSLKKHIKVHQYNKQKFRAGAAVRYNKMRQQHQSRKINKDNMFSAIVTDKTPTIFSCSMCAYQTKRRDKLDKHIQNHVIFEGVHPCGKKRYKPDVPLRRHRHNAEEYKCSLCLYVCTVYKALKRHQKLHVSGIEPTFIKVSCKICGKDKESEAEMERHMKKHRGEGKRLYCDLCSFSSVQLKKVIQHRRIHTGERPHLCPFCNYRCARRDNLRAHVRRMHKRDNMYIDTFIKIEDDDDDEDYLEQ